MPEPWTVPIRGGHPIRGYQAGIVRPMPDRPLVVLRPAPHGIDRIFSADAQARLHRDYEVVLLEGDAADEAGLDAALPRAFAIVGQPDLPAERLERAAALRVVMNVEGQLLPQRRLRGVLPGRHPRPWLRPRLRPGRRRVRAGARDRPRARHQPRGSCLPRGPRALPRGRQRRRDPAARVQHRARRLRQPRPRPPPAPAPVRRHDPGLRPVAPGVGPARGGSGRRRPSTTSSPRARSCSCSRP